MYYNEIIRLKDKYFKLINVRDNKITTHPEVSQNTVPEQLMILNNLLTNFKYFQ